ncbi:ROK family protein [Rhodococcus spongiicola]|uniref:ROK family protein n=1 Tax=Rhodococcus spongiicola TaxID=2487352 RepID=A0A438ASM3_9NOCA|nr:ROK family protein [Rhodococcus spongiicola]RVW01753.1 ROK family protein [Rhodococcus spongiicola]
MTALALDVGGTKMAAARVVSGGSLEHPVTVPTPKSRVWDACASLLRKIAGDATVTSVGIASAGPVDTGAGTVAPVNVAEWRDGFPLVDAVRSLFPSATVALALDGAAAALGEHRRGAGRGTADLLGVVVSTGVGGGLIRGGRIDGGRTGNAGHIGHMAVSGGKELCGCGAVGCLETIASGSAALRWARANGWVGATGADLAVDAELGEPTAVAALERAATALGEAFASAAALLDVDLIVVGGGFAQAGPVLWDPMTATATAHARLSFLRELRLAPAELGVLGTLTGAGLLAIDNLTDGSCRTP